MIEFNGYLSDSAERYYRRKGVISSLKLCGFATLIVLPLIIRMANIFNSTSVIIVFMLFILSWPFIMYFSKSPKERKGLTPKRIYIEDKYIVCIADKYEEIRNIEDITIIYDYSQFYDICFRFGKVSEKFVCQKNLLSIGSLESFEALFHDKIVRKTN